ncbi:phage tail protein [Providencia rustigianii]|uniref:phage tail protein n=1 Tax=Providencia rustigianii TaxID=158850 RepID=UPI0022409FFF|nr:phage tail protein [Providencia rustigianii]
MEIFNWPIKPGMKTDFTPRIKSVRFGDGYEQRQPDGINHQLRKFNINLSLKPSIAEQALSFLAKHSGVTSFLFQPEKSKQTIRVVCKKWSSDSGNIRTSISAEFEEIV